MTGGGPDAVAGNPVEGSMMRAILQRRMLWPCLAVVLGLLVVLAVVMFRGRAGLIYEIRPARSEINVDGVIEPAEWDVAQTVVPKEGTKNAQRTAIRILYDEHCLYVAAACRDSCVTQVNEWDKTDHLWMLISFGRVETAERIDFSFGMTPDGRAYAKYRTGRTPPKREFIDDSQPLSDSLYSVASVRTEDGWSVEFALRWSATQNGKAAPKCPSRFFIERRNINGKRIEVTDWPYRRPVSFVLTREAENK